MIQLIQAPKSNRVLADGNDTQLIIKSVRGAEFYFKANIYIDNTLVIPQSWSKDQYGVSRKNLKLLNYAYFKNPFAIPDSIGIETKTGLYKKVRIEIQEIEIDTGTIVDTLTLPEFYIIKNHKPALFDDTDPIAFLDYAIQDIQVPKDGLLTFPLYTNGQNPIKVSIRDNKNIELFSENYAPPSTKVFQFNLPLSLLVIDEVLNPLQLIISCNGVELKKTIVIISESIYLLKQVFHLNNFGFYLCSYLRGKLKLEHTLKPQKYKETNGNQVTYTIKDTVTVAINTGYGYTNDLAHLIATSIDVRILIEGRWERVSAETKKVQRFQENKFIYEEELKFSKNNYTAYSNNNTF